MSILNILSNAVKIKLDQKIFYYLRINVVFVLLYFKSTIFNDMKNFK